MRGTPANEYFVNAANTIQAVFDDSPEVLKAWKDYFLVLCDKSQADKWQTYRVALLSAMAVSLGYKSFDTSSFLDHYLPEGLGNVYQSNDEIRNLLVPFLKAHTEANHLLIEQLKANWQQAEKS